MILNEERVNSFLSNVGRGFQPPGAGELIAFAVVVLMIVLLFSALPVLRRRAQRRRQQSIARRLFEEAANRLRLSPGDRALMAELAAFSLSPEEIHLALIDRVAFERCARDAAQRGLDLLQILFLRIRAEMQGRQEGQSVRTTADLAPGVQLIETDGKSRLTVLRISEEGLLCDFDEPPATGRDLQWQLERPDGRYRLRAAVLRVEEGLALVQHSTGVRREQKRNFFRVPVALPARLQLRYGETTDLGGGGACLQIPGHEFAAGELHDFELLLPRADRGDERIRCKARVVEASRGPACLRIQFLELREGYRDRIVRYVLREAERIRR